MQQKTMLGYIGQREVVNSLTQRNFHIQQNVIRKPYEFDIIATKRHKIYLIEVRTTTETSDLPLVFPVRKVMNLLCGAAYYYPTAIVLCAYVVKTTKATSISWYLPSELL